MDRATMNKIVEKANYAIQKPRKKQSDRIFMIAGVLIAGTIQGSEWVNEQLKIFGWLEPIKPEERDYILKEAERLILEG